MNIGFVASNLNFSRPIQEEFSRRNHDVQVYQHTADAAQNAFQLGQLRASCQRIFVDWAQQPLDAVLAMFDCPIFVRAHRLEMYNQAYIKGLPWSKVHTLFFIAEHVRERFVSVLAELPQHVEVLPHVGIDGGFWRIIPEERKWEPPWTALIAGNLVPKKRQYEALQLIHDLGPDYRIELIGSGGMEGYGNVEYVSNLQDLIATLEMDDRFVAYGNLPQTELRARMQKSHFVLSTSNEEGCHTTVAEGMACGCVPLVHHWRGATNVYPPEWCWRTPKEFYTLVDRWAALSLEEKQALPEAMYRTVLPAYDVRAIAERIVDCVTGPVDAASVGEWYSTNMLQHMVEQDGNPRQQDALEAVKELLAAEQGDADRQFSVLEIGCGTGYISRELAAYPNVRACGQDIADGLLQFAVDHNPHGATYAKADATEQLIVGPHDIITAIDVLEHIPQRYHNMMLLRVAEQLKPGGVFLARFPHRKSDKQIVEEQLFPKVVALHCKAAKLTVERYGPLPGGPYFEVMARKGGEVA